jgi:two-component system, LytTR family, sensor kinase
MKQLGYIGLNVGRARGLEVFNQGPGKFNQARVCFNKASAKRLGPGLVERKATLVEKLAATARRALTLGMDYRRWLLHPVGQPALFWLGVGLVSFALFALMLGPWGAMLKAGADVLVFAALARVNMSGLFPQFFARRRYLVFAGLLALAVLAAALVLTVVDARLFGQPNFTRPWLRVLRGFPLYNLFLCFLVAVGSTIVKLAQNERQHQAARERFQHQQLQAELDLLKAQINPHFLFNTLNNIYTLAYLKSDQTAEMVNKLAGLMRYLLYDGNAARVPLDSEVAFLQDYVSLYALRDEASKVRFGLVRAHEGPTGDIEPLLFIPLIENCFKYCDLGDEAAFIHIELAIRAQAVVLTTENSVGNAPPPSPGGFGLANLRQRLALLYPGQHQLETRSGPGQFWARLELSTSPPSTDLPTTLPWT